MGKNDLALDFYGLDTSRPIVLTARNGETRRLHIGLLKSTDVEVDLLGEANNVSSSQPDSRYGLVLDYDIDGAAHSSNITFLDGQDTQGVRQEIHVDATYEERLNCRYLTPKFDFYASIEGLVNILKNKDEQMLVDALRIIEPRLNDFVLSESEVLVDIGLPQRIPINMMGDGARKVLALLTTIYECADGIVLVDEISNGFHHSVMGKVWAAVIKAARKNRVQLFVTTHDIDSIRGLRDAVLNESPRHDDDVASFKLLKTADDTLKVYRYSMDGLDYSLNQNIELR